MVRARVCIAEGLSEAEQLREARRAGYKDAGRDVLLDALNSPIQARNSNVSRLPVNQPDYEYKPEPRYRESRDLALPRNGWIY